MHNDSHAHVDALKTQIRAEGREIRVLLECCHAPRCICWWYWWQHALVLIVLKVLNKKEQRHIEQIKGGVPRRPPGGTCLHHHPHRNAAISGSVAAMVPGAVVPVPVHPRPMGACHSLIVPASRSVVARPVINRRAVPIHPCYWSSKSVQSSKPKQVWSSSTQVCKLPCWKLR
jgi:hypothetical protein